MCNIVQLDVNDEDDAECAQPAALDGDTVENLQPDSAVEARLTPRQEQLLVAMMTQPDLAKAARAAGVQRMTAYRWLKQPDFQAALAARRENALLESLEAIRLHVAQAVSGLTDLLDSPDERLRRLACKDVLQQAMWLRDQEDTERRLRALETMAKRGGD